MQPDTTPLKLARDIAAKLNGKSSVLQHFDEQLQTRDRQEPEPAQTAAVSETTQLAIAPESQIQVVPLCTPERSAIKFFCVHPSHRYAMSLVPISNGFQGQVNSTRGTHINNVLYVSKTHTRDVGRT